jgi:hypothetical protein
MSRTHDYPRHHVRAGGGIQQPINDEFFGAVTHEHVIAVTTTGQLIACNDRNLVGAFGRFLSGHGYGSPPIIGFFGTLLEHPPLNAADKPRPGGRDACRREKGATERRKTLASTVHPADPPVEGEFIFRLFIITA